MHPLKDAFAYDNTIIIVLLAVVHSPIQLVATSGTLIPRSYSKGYHPLRISW